MKIKISRKLITLCLLFGVMLFGIVVFGKPNENKEVKGTDTSEKEVVSINVKAGYYPNEVTLPANQQNSLRFITNNTYDCSASLLIPKLKVEQFLPANGATDIQIPAQAPGTEILAGCAMGMYSFKIKFL